jgi:hypothetical protein
VLAILVVIAACSGSNDGLTGSPSVRATEDVADALRDKDRGQQGPRHLIKAGTLPDDHRWLLVAYLRDEGQICAGQVWFENDGRDFRGTCTRTDGPPTVIFNGVTFPAKNDELKYMYGIITDPRVRSVRAHRDAATQNLAVVTHESFPGKSFYIGRIELPEIPETVDLLDASGAVLRSYPFVW